MQQAIVQGREFRKEVTFELLDWLGIKRSRKEKDKYKALINVLKSIGIFLDFVPETR